MVRPSLLILCCMLTTGCTEPVRPADPGVPTHPPSSGTTSPYSGHATGAPGEAAGPASEPGASADNDGASGEDDATAGNNTPGSSADDAPPQDAYVPDDALRFQPPRGLRSTPTSLELSTSVEGGSIFYTLDGSEPSSETGTPYSGPIPLEGTATVRAVVEVSGTAATPIATHTYVFPAQVLQQGDARPEGPHVFWTTEMDPEVVNDPAYSGMIEAAFSAIPSMSIVAPDAAIFGVAGIHRGNNLMPGGGSHGGDDPHPDFVEDVRVSLEMFYAEDFPRPMAGELPDRLRPELPATGFAIDHLRISSVRRDFTALR